MDANRRAAQVVANMRNAVNTSGVPIPKLAQAADIPSDVLDARLSGRDELTIADLVNVGGFLRLQPNSFLKGATS
ncbi:hypothetical protein ACFVWL_10215 [Microbacterium sp. NPDC058269]|uniref:hypothetical protein n=1 Tax=Microbacterium sp. NPDC058269 TaxID=3346414 RepID=UPI0036DB8E13